MNKNKLIEKGLKWSGIKNFACLFSKILKPFHQVNLAEDISAICTREHTAKEQPVWANLVQRRH